MCIARRVCTRMRACVHVCMCLWLCAVYVHAHVRVLGACVRMSGRGAPTLFSWWEAVQATRGRHPQGLLFLGLFTDSPRPTEGDWTPSLALEASSQA